MSERKKRCETCAHFDKGDGDLLSPSCRKNAPVTRGWPVVNADDWCAEWLDRERFGEGQGE